jgi:hypothetical protein
VAGQVTPPDAASAPVRGPEETPMRPGARGAVVALAMAAALLAGCSATDEPDARTAPRHTLTPWFAPFGARLEASMGTDGLCLEAFVDGDSEAPDSGACGFSDRPTARSYMVGATDDGRQYAYGPVPRQTVTVRLRTAAGKVVDVPTAELPSDLADGRYFFTQVEEGALTESVVPLDASGQPVEPQDF